jgi:cell division protein FtsL
MAGKKKKNIRNNKIIGVWIVLVLIFIAELFFYTWCRVRCVRVGYAVTEQRANHQHLIASQKNLRIELARLKSPERITKLAKDRLGLVTPDPKQTIFIK